MMEHGKDTPFTSLDPEGFGAEPSEDHLEAIIQDALKICGSTEDELVQRNPSEESGEDNQQGLSSSMSTMMNSVIDAFKALGKGIQYVGTSLKNLPKNVATATMSVCKAIVDGAKLLGKSSDTGEGKRSLMKHVLSVVCRKMSSLFKAMSKNATGKEKVIFADQADALTSRAQDAGIGGITIGVTEVAPRRKKSKNTGAVKRGG